MAGTGAPVVEVEVVLQERALALWRAKRTVGNPQLRMNIQSHDWNSWSRQVVFHHTGNDQSRYPQMENSGGASCDVGNRTADL